MKRRNATRSALFTSIVSLLLCVSMLVGTTFAWFTDSVESGRNVIVAGNLDVELEYAKVVDGKITTWNTVERADKIFDPDALWEPGRVEVAYLKVSNLGTLALKYQLGVNVAKETSGVNVNGENFKLSDHLVFKAIVMDELTTYDNREAAALASGSEKGLKDYNGNTTALEVGGVDYVALIVYMPETVGNEANYMTGTTRPEIELGINLYATQVEAESDSFGDDYDEDAWNDAMQIYSAEDLQAAVNNGKTEILLMDNIVVPEGQSITIPAGAKVSFNLNGKTLSSTGASTIIVDGAALTVEGDGKIVNDGGYEAIGLMNGATVIFNSGNIESNGDGIYTYGEGNSVVVNGGTITVPDVDGHPAVAVQAGSSATINGGTLKGALSLYAWEGSDASVTGGKLIGAFGPSPSTTVSGGAFSGHFYANPEGALADGYKVIDAGNDNYYVVPNDVDNVITSAEELQTALDNATGDTVIVLAADITGDVTVLQKVGVNIVIDGKGYKYDGTIYLEGGTQGGSSPETLTIQNVNFVASETNDFISANDQTPGKRYAHNVTVQNCTFTGADGAEVVGMRYRQTYNMNVIDCTATKMHSLMWATGGNGITIDKVTLTNCLNGVSFGTSFNVVVKNSNIEAVKDYGYGVRADASGAYDLTIENTTINADAALLLRKATGNYTATATSTTLNGKIIVTAADYEEGAVLTAPTGNVKLTINDKTMAYPENVQAVIDAAVAGDVIALLPGEYHDTLVMKSGITIEGTEGAVVDCVKLNGSQNVTLKNIEFDAADAVKDPNGNFYTNIMFRGNSSSSQNITIDGCKFNGTFEQYSAYASIYTNDAGLSGERVKDVTITNCEFNALGYAAIKLDYASAGTITITNNKFNDFYAYAVNPGTSNSSDVIFEGNTVVFTSNFNPGGAALMSASRNGTQKITFKVTGNTFTTDVTTEGFNPAIVMVRPGASYYNADNFAYEFSGNTFAGELAGLTEATANTTLPY